MSVVSDWRDNLGIGLYLATHNHGAGSTRDDALVGALGYNPNGVYPHNDYESYIRRFQRAQQIGEQKYAARTPGYFTIKAQPFGNIFVYRALWYIWRNPTNGIAQGVPLAQSDLSSARRFNDKYVATRSRTARNVRTADQIQRQREAVALDDVEGVYAIQAEMVTDGTLTELLTSQLGLPHAELAPVLQDIAEGQRINIHFNFRKTARKIRRLNSELLREQARFTEQLSTWITMKTGLPGNARQLALADAQHRFTSLP